MTMTHQYSYSAKRVHPGEFEAQRHWYPKALGATIHPMVQMFLNLSREKMIHLYCNLHPTVNPAALAELLAYQCRYFLWAGADLIHVTTAAANARRHMVIIENNSCPSGQKSMPLTCTDEVQGGYRLLIERTFKPYLERKPNGLAGVLAVVYDKNHMEASGYAAVIADVMNEPVFLVPFFNQDALPPVRYTADGQMEVRDAQDQWHLVRAAFRYVTQSPWNRLALHTKTPLFNPVEACLAGGRNKMMAAQAYEQFNTEWHDQGLRINIPETMCNVRKEDIPRRVAELGGQAVVKVPYSNAGQGVYTIVSPVELEKFMAEDFKYKHFLVQGLIGNSHWDSTTTTTTAPTTTTSATNHDKLYHVGTIPNANGKTYVADLRMMVSSTDQGIRPLCVYARRASKPLQDRLEPGCDSWGMLGTNLSIKNPNGTWDSDTDRLVLMDGNDFQQLGIGLNDLIEAYIQTVLSTVAIDKMAQSLVNGQGHFRMNLFQSINNDPAFIQEIAMGSIPEQQPQHHATCYTDKSDAPMQMQSPQRNDTPVLVASDF